MRSDVMRWVVCGAAAVMVGCASAPPEAAWPEQKVNMDDMVTTTRWVAPIPLPAPDLVRDRSRTSTVVLEANVGADGKVQAARVATSSLNAQLDASALQSLRELRFNPYSENGVAMPVTVVAPMTFKFYDRPR